MSDRIQWGIIGTGAIAKAFAHGMQFSKTGKLVAVGSRAQATADAFAAQYGNIKAHGSYEALLADKEVQAVYISTPHPQHAEWTVKAAEAGKHILCEKPFTVNYADAMAVIEQVRKHDVFLMEAFMYRCHPQTAKLVELIREGAIGQVRMIQAAFGFQGTFNPNGRTFANDSAGGGIMDVGCYPVSLSRLVAGVAQGKAFAEPLSLTGAAMLGPVGTDHWAAGVMKFDGNIIAQVATGVELGLENCARIFGSEGNIHIPSPWTADRKNPFVGKIVLTRKGKGVEELTQEADGTSYAIEADIVGRAIQAGKRQADSPAMTWDDTLGNIRALDRWREAVGLMYEHEVAPRATTTVANRPLRRDPGSKPAMRYARIPGLDKPVARLCCGGDMVTQGVREAMRIWDDYFERGGNLLDTARVYGGGKSETAIGHWVRSRGVRDQVYILAKGAHTPNCFPDKMASQFKETLDCLKLDSADIYMLHRDNPTVPVGEFIDVLNEHVKAGLFKVFGGSNWSIQRVEQANAYAKSKGLQGFTAVSNNFSLARMVDPVWAGCIAASDAESRAWYTRTQMVLIPWSSQARGFFTDRSGVDKREDAELVRCWYSDDNFQRKQRAEELAKKYGVSAINIALAYVLCQPFPTFPLIGPRQIVETRTSMPGLEVQLTPDELKWLNLEA